MSRRLTGALIATTLVGGTLTSAVLPTAAEAGVSAPIDCPKALPTKDAVEGLTGTGFTVSQGTKPQPFSVTVLGTLDDGIAPGVDMIMVEASSAAVTRAGGIWAGMSGSPVYTADGKLIGSVSYGLATNSPIAGLTPATDLNAIYAAGSTSGVKAATKVATTSAARKTLVATKAVTASKAAQGFVRLAPAVTVSGGMPLRAKQKAALTKALGTTLRAGNASRATSSDPSTIFAGSNFAAALSYGAVTLSGVGTTTTVCHGRAVAFGHPFLSYGSVGYSAHSATAITIQPDPTGTSDGPFKVANVGGVVGMVDRDLTTGLRAKLGTDPGGFPITSTLSLDGGPVRKSTTVSVDQTELGAYSFAGYIAGSHAYQAVQGVLGSNGGGTADLTFTVKGRRAGGQEFTLTLHDRYAEKTRLANDPAYAAQDLVDQLLTQPYEPVTLTSVDITGNVTSTYTAWDVNNVRVWKKGAWAKGVSATATAGKTLKFRASLSPLRSERVVYWTFSVKVPKGASGTIGTASVLTGDNFYEDEFTGTKAQRFDALLAQLGRASSAGMFTTLDLDGFAPVTAGKLATGPIVSYQKDYDVTVK